MSLPVGSMRAIATAVRGRRISLELSQTDVAARARVSRVWLSEFEAGKPTAELGLVLRLLDALDLDLLLRAREEEDSARGAPEASVDLDALLEDHRGQ